MTFFGETKGEEAFDKAMDMVAEVAEETVSDLELDGGTEFDINGIKAIEFSGSGTSDGTDVFVSVVLMAAAARMPGIHGLHWRRRRHGYP